jgi:hypothetical protein
MGDDFRIFHAICEIFGTLAYGGCFNGLRFPKLMTRTANPSRLEYTCVSVGYGRSAWVGYGGSTAVQRMTATGAQRKCRYGSLPAAIRGIRENLCEAPGDRQGVEGASPVR